ncbi:MAG: sulfurtransferase TusA [Pseudomonadales bacterium]|nr:sulfurtransferase TusA [Pseudomonadales bacterium]
MPGETENQSDKSLDASGLLCPEPLMLVRSELRSMKAGETLLVQATDPSTSRDLTNLCRFMGHELVSESQESECWTFLIRKG